MSINELGKASRDAYARGDSVEGKRLHAEYVQLINAKQSAAKAKRGPKKPNPAKAWLIRNGYY